MSTELIKKAILNVSEGSPIDFKQNMSAVMSDKLKVKIGSMVKEKEKEIMSNFK